MVTGAVRQEAAAGEHNFPEFADKDGDGRLSLSEYIKTFEVPTNLHDPSVSTEENQEHAEHIAIIKVRKPPPSSLSMPGTLTALRASTGPPFEPTAPRNNHSIHA